jgi:hypothetical protein
LSGEGLLSVGANLVLGMDNTRGKNPYKKAGNPLVIIKIFLLHLIEQIKPPVNETLTLSTNGLYGTGVLQKG